VRRDYNRGDRMAYFKSREESGEEPLTFERLRREATKRRYEVTPPRINPYRAIRILKKWSQSRMAETLEMTLEGYQYRERVKCMFYPMEIALLFELSELPADKFMELWKDIA